MSENVLPMAPRDDIVVSGPRVQVAIDVSASYLRERCVDVAEVIGDVQQAIAEALNGQSSSDTISVVALTAVAESVPGVATVRRLTIGGAGGDYVGVGGAPYLQIAASVDAAGAQIVNAG